MKVLLIGTRRTCQKAASLSSGEIILIPFPVLDTKVLEDIIFPQTEYEWLFLTSPAAALHFSQLKHKAHFKKVAVVGPATENAAKKAGFTVTYVPKNFNSESFSMELLKSFPKIENALFPCSSKADDTIYSLFNEAGCNVDRIDLYEPLILEKKDLPEYDAAVFFSSSSAETFYRIYGHPGTKKIAAIGKKAAKTVKECFGIDALVPANSTALDTIQTLL